jgi:hypothetical protein
LGGLLEQLHYLIVLEFKYFLWKTEWVQFSVENVMRKDLNAPGCELLSSQLLPDQYLCSDFVSH